MKIGVMAKLLGVLVIGLAGIGMIPLTISLFHPIDDAPWPWLAMIGSALGLGGLGMFLGRHAQFQQLGIREGITVTSLVWFFASIVAAVPFWVGTPATFIDGWFEAMSGFTTTGSTVFGQELGAISSLPDSILLWRNLMQWMGGIGIVVISLTLLPLLTGGSGFQLYRAEMPGINTDRLAPRIVDTARILLAFYLGFTVVVTLGLLACGVSVFNAICHALSTVSTGGFSPLDNSAEGLNSKAAEWVLIAGMLLGGINFGLLLLAIRGKPMRIWRNIEARVFLIMVSVATLLVALDLAAATTLYPSWHDLIRDSAFQVISLATSTGFATGYEATPGGHGWEDWPAAAKMVIIAMMIVGGCTGSTAGGTKVVRWLVAWKGTRRELRRFIEPARISPVRLDGQSIGDGVVLQVGAFFFIYACTWAFGTILLAFFGNDFTTAASACLSSISNMGPGLGEVGSSDNFHSLGAGGKVVCIALMLLGRLEFFGLLIVVSLKHWRR